MNNTMLVRIAASLTIPLALAGCRLQEAGIDDRHVIGLAIIPPSEYVEVEASDESTNDTFDTAEFDDSEAALTTIGYRYATIRGTLSSIDYVFATGEYRGDHDYYRFLSGVEGDIQLLLQWDNADADLDLYIYDLDGEQLAAANVVDDTVVVDLSVTEEQELYCLVVGRSEPDDGSYDGSYVLAAKGLDPSEAGEVMLGAYLNPDVENLGNPVSGTSIEEWNDDAEFFRYWATFDMYIVQSVEVIENVFLDPSLEDGIDNNCDGVTDLGEDESDADGDGASIANGDCDDNDPTVRPGWPDDFGDGIDGDCDGWADNGPDGSDRDGDGQSSFDGDCNDADDTIYSTLQTEEEMAADLGLDLVPDGKDNNCDGIVDDNTEESWPDDNDADGYTVADGDCNDADPTIVPCDATTETCYDYRDGKDNDCDFVFGDMDNFLQDENFEYICPSGTCGPTDFDAMEEDPIHFSDDDGDGYSEFLGDCNDANDFVYPGNYELRTYYQVNSDIDLVYLYAGTFTNLNTTATVPGDLVMSQPMALDMSEYPENVDWDMNENWFETGGVLVPDGLPEVILDINIPPLFGGKFYDTEPNDCDIGTSASTWSTCAQVLDGAVAMGGAQDRIYGTFSTIVADTWDGDNDTYYVVAHEDGYINAELDWVSEGGDMDMYFLCYYGDDYNPWGWYSLMDETMDLSKPEADATVIPVPEGTECYAWTVGYSGPNGEEYTLKLWMTSAE